MQKAQRIGLVFLFIISICNAQKPVKVFFNKDWEEDDSTNAMYYRIYTPDKRGNPVGPVKDYYMSGKIQFEGSMSSVDLERKNGKCTWYYENGQVQSVEIYNEKGNQVGKSVVYYENGQKAVERDYTYDTENIIEPYIEYYPDGKKKSEGYLFQSGQNVKEERAGENKYWRPDGTLHFIDWFDNEGEALPLSHYWTKGGSHIMLHTGIGIEEALYNLKLDLYADSLKIPDDSLILSFNEEPYKKIFELIPLHEGENKVTGLRDSSYKVLHIKNEKLNGLCTAYEKNGTKISEGEFIDNRKTGVWKQWFSGVLYSETNYKMGVRDGEEKKWQGPILEKHNNYKNGRLHGKCEEIYFWDGPDGSSPEYYAINYYDHGRLGKSEFYYVDTVKWGPGHIMSTGGYNTYNEKYTGPVIQYYENGKIMSESMYKDGKLTGKSVLYYSNGKKMSEGESFGGHLPYPNSYGSGKISSYWDSTGKQVIVNGNGIIIEKGTEGKTEYLYQDGCLIKLTRYHSNDTIAGVYKMSCPDSSHYYSRTIEEILFDEKGIKFQEKIENDSMTTYTLWYPNGNKRQVNSYRTDISNSQEGAWIEYHENGNKSVEGMYHKNRKSGSWKYYDTDGKLTKEEIYKYGRVYETH